MFKDKESIRSTHLVAVSVAGRSLPTGSAASSNFSVNTSLCDDSSARSSGGIDAFAAAVAAAAAADFAATCAPAASPDAVTMSAYFRASSAKRCASAAPAAAAAALAAARGASASRYSDDYVEKVCGDKLRHGCRPLVVRRWCGNQV
jgi:hypothetical protein